VLLAGLHDEGDLVHVAPRPVLARFERGDDRVVTGRGVFGGVLVGGGVAAADVTAGAANPQMNPPTADAKAVLAALELIRGVDLDLIEVSAGRHVVSLTRTASGRDSVRFG
jgi:hypothetical protein